MDTLSIGGETFWTDCTVPVMRPSFLGRPTPTVPDFARRYCAALSERMFALVRCGRYLGGGPEGVPAPIVAPTCEDEPR